MMSSENGEEENEGGGSASGGGIDWGIEVDESGVTASAPASGEVSGGASGGSVDEGGIDWGEGIAAVSGSSAESADRSAADTPLLTLADATTRASYSNDLLELSAFLGQRLVELSRDSGSTSSLALQQSGSVQDGIRSVDRAGVADMLAAVAAATEAISGDGAVRVLALQASSAAVERAAREITEKKHAAVRLQNAIKVLAKRKAGASAELRALVPRFEELRKETREVIRDVEKRISMLYKGREVHILGEINVILPEDDE